MIDVDLARSIADMLSKADNADVDATVRVAIADMARLLATVGHLHGQVTDPQAGATRTLERARDAERQLASEREQHSRLREQWEIMSAELARTRTDRQRVMFECAKAREELEQAQARAALDVPPELARLYKAAQGARGRFGPNTQRVKLAEECGEFVAEYMRTGERFDAARVSGELHDVLTVALSLCEPALMAVCAERLEARLA